MINSKGVAQNHGMAHAFILSADSGNIIDATYDDGRHYKKSAEPHSLEKFVLGQPLYSKDSTWIYDPYPYRTPEDIKANHPLSKVQLLSKESLQNLDGQKVNSKIALSADHSIALLTHTYANGTGTYYEVYARTSDSPETYLRTAKGMRKDLSDLLLAKLNGDTLRLDIEKDWISGDIKAILLKEDKPQIALSPDNLQKPAGSRETLVKIIQNNLGLEADGIWGPQTNQKFANLMAEVQFTKSYTRQFDDKSGDSAHPNFFYGEETRAAMYALQYDRQLIDAIDQLDQSGELDNLYHGPASVRDSVKHVDAQKTTAVQLTTDREIRASVSPISAYPGLENLKF
ncbi:MAG: hypothetical protein K9G62_08660 [Alphaproteobacteria bacterium]|nr:hypothetical protein [Alphaproteobacteria bacterium]